MERTFTLFNDSNICPYHAAWAIFSTDVMKFALENKTGSLVNKRPFDIVCQSSPLEETSTGRSTHFNE